MTTTFEDAPDHTQGADEAPPGEATTRLRRFAPRRSRSAGAPASAAPAVPPSMPASMHAPEPPAAIAPDIVETRPDARQRVTPEPRPDAVAPSPKPSRRSRARGATAPAVSGDAAQPAVATVPSGAEIGAAPVEPQAPPEPAPPRTTRARARRRPAAARDVEAAPTEPAAETGIAAQAAPPAEPVAAEVETQPAATVRPARPRRGRRQPAAPPIEAEPETSDVEVPATPVAEIEPPEAVHSTTWFPNGEMSQSAPGGDLDGTDALARALLEMFPPEAEAALVEDEDMAPDEAALTAALTAPDVLAEAQAILEGQDEEETGDDGQPRRRSRRGRRGGRGRRRGALSAVPPIDAQAAEHVPSDDDLGPPGEEFGPAAEAGETPPAAIGPSPALFVPESPPRQDRPWRERGPRRVWGRTYGRELSPPVNMPPPKPSNGARFAPIPQAAPPLSAAAQPEIALPAPTPIAMPDLGLDTPLGPGETRTERLLEAQIRLMQAMLGQQTQQIDALTANIQGLRQTVNNLAGGGGALRTYQPRTGIFVDAPNVCYAAENARVNLDFGRMLKYLSHDRYLVHAFAYSPIIDDVREGIRYETQRFVAPFLRTGYKLVTKPLKRFSDGSAKGNFDIELAVDIVTMSERLDLVVLVSGDSDFERMIELIQSRGVRVEVVAFASNVSTELVNIADVFIDINQHIEHMRAL